MEAFVSVISTDSYSFGALALYESLRRTQTSYPFYLLITQDVSKKCENSLIRYGINVIRDDENILADNINSLKLNEKRWNYTFDKLKIFRLEQMSKIVYLDSDMYVVDNIDNLFTFSHLSAVPTRASVLWLSNQKYFNSGLMVIEPSINEYKRILEQLFSTIDEFSRRKSPLGDQNVLHNSFLEWPMKDELHIPDGYNVFWGSIDLYIRNYNYTLNKENQKKRIYVVHFTGSLKPWLNPTSFFIKSMIRPIKNLKRLPILNVLSFLSNYNQSATDIKKNYLAEF